MIDWHHKTVSDTASELGADLEKGLRAKEARERLEKWGPNSIAAQKKESRARKFAKQFTEFIILVLIGAAVIAGVLGEWIDAAAILAIVVLNGVIGFLQEEKAERVMEALKKLSAPVAKVVRDGHALSVPASELVAGDVVLLESGDHVPADCRITDSRLLRIQEAPLTGESTPIEKSTDPLEDSVPLADRTNMAYLGTNVVYGRGRAVVVATGMSTEMGGIAKLLQEVRPESTPLQKRLAEFGRYLVYAAGGICALIFALGVLRGVSALEMFLVAVSLAVAAIPEGLPAVVTVVLALGVQRMVKRHALIRKLPSVETLGAATVIASDKTGTLTQNQMTVKRLHLPGGRSVTVTGAGYAPEGQFYSGGREIDAASMPGLMLALKTGVLCNGAELREKDGAWTVVGDPTEGALLTLAAKAGLEKGSFSSEMAFVSEIPFDAERKMMTAVYRAEGSSHIAFVKGAAERVLPLCSHVFEGGKPRPVTDADRKEVERATEDLSKDALRVLALAIRTSDAPLDARNAGELEKELTFVGLAGMIDPPREEVFAAVELARKAGITPVMITGDHRLTAVAIADELGFLDPGDRAVDGEELDRMSEGELKAELAKIKVYARVSPAHKMRIVRAWKDRGEIIAMTGDGVNDAPALKEADIGIAMGITGTDVTKEASDMVLTDDNFASIVSAVEEGRSIFDNIRRVVHFLLSCNIGEIFVLLVASLAGMPLPLLPVQILWTNLVTDGLPALGLAMEPVEAGVMDRAPRKKDEGIVTGPLLWVMLAQGAFIGAVTLGAYSLELYRYGAPWEKARTVAFMVLVFSQMFHVFNCRSTWKSIFSIGALSNKMLNLAVLVILVGQLSLIYIPGLDPVFKIVHLSPFDWTLVFAASIQPLILMEVVKAVWLRGRHNNRHG